MPKHGYLKKNILLLVSIFILSSPFLHANDACRNHFENLKPQQTTQKHQEKIDASIKFALRHKTVGTRLEGEVAAYIREYVLNFRKEFFKINKKGKRTRSIGEIDIETPNFIIEVKSGSVRVTWPKKQGRKLKTNELINPTGKQVIMFCPTPVTKEMRNKYRGAGFLIFSELDELLEFLISHDVPVEVIDDLEAPEPLTLELVDAA